MKSSPFYALALLLLSGTAWSQADLKISEVSTTEPDWIEIINLGNATGDLSNHKIRFGGNSGAVFTQAVYTIPAGTMLAPYQTLVITEDPTANIPVVPAGVFKAYAGASIVWGTTPAAGTNGVVALNNSFDIGLDRMLWGNPLQTLSTYGSGFTGTIAPTGSVIYRWSPFDTDTTADWGSSGTSTPGQANPGEANVIDLVFSSPGPGGIIVDVATYAAPVPNGEIFNLFSLVDTIPDGSGPLFGIGADALLQATTPVDATNPFHTNLDANGNWQLFVPPATLPVGFHIEGVSLLIQGTVTRISDVAVITL